MLFITQESPVTVLAVRLHNTIISIISHLYMTKLAHSTHHLWCALISMSPVRDMLFITHASSVTVLAVSVRLHMSIISQYGLSALMLAAYEGHTEVVTQLLKARAKTDLQDQVHYTLILSNNYGSH